MTGALSAAEHVFVITDLAAIIVEHVGGREAWRFMAVSKAARAGAKERLRKLVEKERAGDINNAFEVVELPFVAARKGDQTLLLSLIHI